MITFVSQSLFKDLNIQSSLKIFVIKNGVHIKKWIPSKNKSLQFPIRLISNAGTALHKGWHYLIEAIQALPKEMQN